MNITPADLRIGNWVQAPRIMGYQTVQVTPALLTMIAMKDGSFDAIKLDISWLEAFSFEINDISSEAPYHWCRQIDTAYFPSKATLGQSGDGWIFGMEFQIITNNGLQEKRTCYHITKIHHVHQLQNLVHSIFDIEL